uniref:AP2/ERF transcription factor n=1 Tax=Camptotheca acuminata TaxID=16922 RepID=A0A7G8AUD3_CAMAC|nr:AP2/ERF transcription factor [Camptotheca acuminata]
MANPANVRQIDPPPNPLVLLEPSNSSEPSLCVLPPENQPPTEVPSAKYLQSTIASPSGSGGGGSTGKHPIYHGIRSRSRKWVTEIREPRKTTRIWLGTYPTPEMAAAAYDVAALALKGPDTALNFPNSVLSYPIPASPSANDIRSAAAIAAASKLQKPQSGESPVPSQPEKEEVPKRSGEEFIDEDALFDMPNLLLDMAGGMLVSPPRMKSPQCDYSPENSYGESLWSYP